MMYMMYKPGNLFCRLAYWASSGVGKNKPTAEHAEAC